MPTNRRRRRPDRRLDVETLPYDMVYTLASGKGLLEQYPTEDVCAAWEAHGEWLLEAWVDSYPGSRPFGWYLCVGVPEFGERRVLADRRYPLTSEGREHCSRHGILNTHTIAPRQEPEVDYLRRNGQLSGDEEAALARGEGIQCVSGYPSAGLEVLLEAARKKGLLVELI